MKLKVNGARLSYPSLWTPREGQTGDDGKKNDPRFEASFIIYEDKHADFITEMRAAAKSMLIAKYGQNYPKGFKLCLRSGMEETKAEVPGYGPGTMFVPTGSKSKPVVVHRDPSVPVGPNDNVIYAGCYVNASFRLWIQDNKFGKRINAELLAVQFYKDGERFGEGPVDAESEFDNLEDGDTAGMLGGEEGDPADLSLL